MQERSDCQHVTFLKILHRFGFSTLLENVSESEACSKYKLHFETKFTLNFADHLKNGTLYMKMVHDTKYKGKVYLMTCLFRHKGAVEVWLLTIGKPVLEGDGQKIRI
jgi:hypothetical protein